MAKTLTPADRKGPLSVAVVDGELVIRIGVDTLAGAVTAGDAFHQLDEASDKYVRSFAISDAELFAEDVAIALQQEEEDGSSPISNLLDLMAQEAIDDGSLGVEYDRSVEYGQKDPSETWGAE